jgi:hypothetical protein
MCTGCKNLQIWEKNSMPYQCVSEIMGSDCAARVSNSGYSSSGKVHTETNCKFFAPGKPVSEQEELDSESKNAVLDTRPRPKFVTLLITGLIVSVVWAAAIAVYGKTKNDLVIEAPVILTFLCGIPAGTVAFTLLRLLKNTINKSATNIGVRGQIGGNLFGWLVANLLPWLSPAIVYFIFAAFVFHTRIF